MNIWGVWTVTVDNMKMATMVLENYEGYSHYYITFLKPNNYPVIKINNQYFDNNKSSLVITFDSSYSSI